jgi:hypothetical protein
MIDDCVIDALLKIGNDENFKKLCEPHVCYRFTLQRWMVERTVKAIGLLNKEWEEYKKRPQIKPEETLKNIKEFMK